MSECSLNCFGFPEAVRKLAVDLAGLVEMTGCIQL